jgi:hypothetical protein
MPFISGRLHYLVVCLGRSCAFIAWAVLLTPALWLGASLAAAQTAPAAANSDPTYQALRNLTLGGEAVSVNNLELKREAGTFHLRSGTVCFTAAVNGKVTGAVFEGDGNLVLSVPPSETEMLKLLTKESEFSENFGRLVLRFTDSTYDEIKKAGAAATAGCDNGPLKDSQNTMRHDLRLKHNLEARILQDVLAPGPGGLFVAFVHGKHYNGKEIFGVDPYGAPYISGEEVGLMTYDENKYGVWAAFPLSGLRKQGTTGNLLHIEHEQLDTTIEKNGHLSAKATTTFVSRINGLQVVPFDLFRPLRVQSVSADGQALPFIQEDKNDDGDFAVILPKPLGQGEKYTITTVYAGKEAVSNEGGGNYFPVSRDNWYPNNPVGSFGDFALYDLTFRIPKGMKMAATGQLVSENTEGGQNITVWKSEVPQTVAGFSFGDFKVEEAKLTQPEYTVQSYANKESPNWVQALQHSAQGDNNEVGGGVFGGMHGPQAPVGTMSTTGLNKKALAEGELAIQLYTDYFGPSAFKHIQLTQQSACNFGQSWPELVWIPICYYFDTTVRHQLGMDWGDRGYWKVVTPHEVAHQWWGNTVGFGSYRDQWMSEGFADLSASLFIGLIEKNPQKFIAFWNDERDLLLERDAGGVRAIDSGPLTMGYRTSNSRTGFGSTRRLIYPKGAYVLHMIRMMMYDNHTGDQRFKELMQDFVRTYGGKAATTEDFKAIVEKHVTPDMDQQGNKKMDWFFNEYVFGTQLPAYKFDYSFDTGANGDVIFNFKVTQSNVGKDFRMPVPVYLEMADGKIFMLGRAKLMGDTSVDQKIPLNGVKTKPRRAMVNYFDDVLASPN